MRLSSRSVRHCHALRLVTAIRCVGICLSVLVVAAACASVRTTSLAPASGVLLPGAPDLVTESFRNGSTRFHIFQDGTNGSATARGLGEGRTETHVTSYQRTPALLFISSFTGRGTPFLDSALVLRDGLVAVWEIHHVGGRRTRFDYNGSHVSLDLTAPDSARHQTAHTYDRPVFHFNELDALIRAVPLRAGYHAIVPFYSEMDDALEMDTITVETHNSSGTWNVRFADKVIIGHYGIDPAERVIIRHDVERHTGGAHFHFVRVLHPEYE